MTERIQSPENVKPIKRIFIAERGEIALRAVKTCLARGIPAIIPDTFADLNPLASKLVAENLENGWGLVHLGGTSVDENFANPQILLESMQLPGLECDAIFLGYGPLSENESFVKQCEEVGITVLAPPSDVMKKTGNKISARGAAQKVRIGPFAHIPVLEGTGNLKTYEEAVNGAKKLGFPAEPVIMKDPNTGGGGNPVIRTEQELENAFMTLKGRPGNTEVFMERFVKRPVHVEVQIVADAYGNVVYLGERDCTMQRRGQKVIEESPSPHISNRMRRILQIAAVRFAKAIHYRGVGTWEFIIDLDRRGRGRDPAWYFMEVNPRIQVEHPVTEEQTGIDIVGLMIDIAEGKALPFTQKDIKTQGHTIEARVYAESPERNFEKSDGEVTTLSYPEVEGVRIDPGVGQGDTISFWYDRTIFKAIAHGSDRETARQRLVRLLTGTQITGVSNNLLFLAELLDTEEFRQGKATTNFVEDWWRQRLKDKVHLVSEFINGGSFTPYPPTSEYNNQILPETSAVVSRRDGSTITYRDHLDKLAKEKGTVCAAQYGIQERDGVQWVLYTLDFNINAGVLGPQEGNVFKDACQLAYEKGLALVTLISTGGVDQWTNTLALHQMTRTVAILKNRFPPRVHINVYHGPAYGGVPASFAGAADFQVIVDSPDTREGFAGAFLIAKNAGINLPENTKAADVYKYLEEHDDRFKGLHSPIKQYQDRNSDYVAGSLKEASDKVAHLVHTFGYEESVTDVLRIFEPREQIALREGSSHAERFDRPGIHLPVWLSPVSHLREGMLSRITSRYQQNKIWSNIERWDEVHRVTRATGADLLDTRFGLFDDTVMLSGPILHFGEDEYYPSIIAAIARIEEFRLLVLAQQTQRVKDELTEEMIKRYNAQKPQDWEFVRRKIEGIGLKNRLPILTITDTEGADPSPEAEAAGQSIKIQETIYVRDIYPYTSLAFLSGLKGSGGGEALFSPADGAAAAENSLAFVSDPRTKPWIQGGPWFDGRSKEFEAYINGETTARAEVLLAMGLIDTVILEGPGGAHRNPRLFAQNIRSWLLSELRRDTTLSVRDRVERRWERNERPSMLHNFSS